MHSRRSRSRCWEKCPRFRFFPTVLPSLPTNPSRVPKKIPTKEKHIELQLQLQTPSPFVFPKAFPLPTPTHPLQIIKTITSDIYPPRPHPKPCQFSAALWALSSSAAWSRTWSTVYTPSSTQVIIVNLVLCLSAVEALKLSSVSIVRHVQRRTSEGLTWLRKGRWLSSRLRCAAGRWSS